MNTQENQKHLSKIWLYGNPFIYNGEKDPEEQIDILTLDVYHYFLRKHFKVTQENDLNKIIANYRFEGIAYISNEIDMYLRTKDININHKELNTIVLSVYKNFINLLLKC